MTTFSKHLILFHALFFLCGCYTVPITNRPTLVLALPGQDELIGKSEFRRVLAFDECGAKSNNKTYNERVDNICSNLIKAANAESPNSWDWEIAVTDFPEENAFCLPGGKIVVFTGLLDNIKNDDELAAVIGHEMGHALGRHYVEERTFILLADLGKNISYAVVNPKYAHWIYLGEVVFPFLFQWFNRYHETEADHIGLMLMAKAGYDPNKAVEFWKRKPDYGYNYASSWLISFLMLADHPSASERASDLEDIMDEANKLYAAAPIKRSQKFYTQSSRTTSTSTSANNVSVVINKPDSDGGTKVLSHISETIEQAKTLKSSSELTEPIETQSSQTDDQLESDNEKEK